MRNLLLHESGGLRTFAVVFDPDDEAKSGIEQFAREHDVTGASLSAIGAFKDVVLAYFDPDVLEYQDLPVAEQVEVLSLLGDIALDDDEPTVHAHAVVGRRDGTTAGGHLQAGHVWPTLEVIVQETPVHLRKRVDSRTGLALIDLEEASRRDRA